MRVPPGKRLMRDVFQGLKQATIVGLVTWKLRDQKNFGCRLPAPEGTCQFCSIPSSVDVKLKKEILTLYQSIVQGQMGVSRNRKDGG